MPLSPEQIADGWIEHDGSDKCPVAHDARVSVLYWDGFISHDDEPGDQADGWDWGDTGQYTKIIAYRPYRLENRHD